MSSTLTEKITSLKEQAKIILAESNWLRWVSFVLALISIALAIALTVLELFNIAGAAYYRGGLFAMHGIMALIAIGAWVDREPFDVKLLIASSVIAFVIDVYTAGWETARAVQCANAAPITAVDNNICFGESSLYYINTIFAWAFTVIALLQIVVSIVWLGRLDNAIGLKTKSEVMAQKSHMSQFGRFLIGQKNQMALTSQTISDNHLGKPWLATAHKALGVIGGIIFLAVAIIEMIMMKDVAFYRSVLLLVAAHSIGASLSAFGAVPYYWSVIILILAVLGGALALTCMIIDIGRQARCGAPVGVYETTICGSSGWLGYVVPVESSIVFVLMVLSIVFSIWSLITRRSLRVKPKADVPPK